MAVDRTGRTQMRKRQINSIRTMNLNRALDAIGTGANSKLAKALGVNPSYVSNLRHGRQVIGDQTAEKIERALNLPSNSLDEGYGPSIPAGDWTQVPEIECEELLTATGGEDADDGRSFYLCRTTTLQALGIAGEYVVATSCRRASMSPTVQRDDLLLCTVGADKVLNRRVYLFQWGGEVQIGRFFLQADGSYLIRFDNPDRTQYPEVLASEGMEGFRVLARVHWRGGAI